MIVSTDPSGLTEPNEWDMDVGECITPTCVNRVYLDSRFQDPIPSELCDECLERIQEENQLQNRELL